REDCEARGATLLLPRDRDELELLNETLQKPGRSFWIGLWEPAGGSGWTWVNGSGLERHRCPLDIREGPGHCGATNGRAVKAQECGSELQWICQRGATEL
ncbi:KRBBB protein, partial [Pomatostomus ruficeps]|nr:KRBBB protein [Pomatostomus ruficeps]